MGSGNWIIDQLNSALETWNQKLSEIWQLLTQSPETFRGGGVWDVMLNINGALKLFIRFVLAKAAVSYGLDLMGALFDIIQGSVTTIMASSGMGNMAGATLPPEIITKIEEVSFWDSIPLWIVTLLGGLVITVLSLIMILSVYGRMFKLFMYTAIAPLPLSSFAGQPSSSIGKNFLRSYAGVCLEGAIIALACIIFSALASSPPMASDPDLTAVTVVWNYLGELVFNLLVLVGAVKMSDRIVKEILGL